MAHKGTPKKPKKIKRPTFTELDIGMKDPNKKTRSVLQKSMHGDLPMTPMEKAEYLRSFGSKFIEKVGSKGYTRKGVKSNAAKFKGTF